jgi:hypothetical protein
VHLRGQRPPRPTSWDAETADGLLAITKNHSPYRLELDNGRLKRTKLDTNWRGRWPASPSRGSIAIPGARDLRVGECVVGQTAVRQSLGVKYALIPRGLAAKLEPLEGWCNVNAERSIRDANWFFIQLDTWVDRKTDSLDMPFIPEYDEAADDLRRVAIAERKCREAAQLLDEERDARKRAMSQAVRRRSRRRVSEASGLSFARVQQIVSRSPTSR